MEWEITVRTPIIVGGWFTDDPPQYEWGTGDNVEEHRLRFADEEAAQAAHARLREQAGRIAQDLLIAIEVDEPVEVEQRSALTVDDLLATIDEAARNEASERAGYGDPPNWRASYDRFGRQSKASWDLRPPADVSEPPAPGGGFPSRERPAWWPSSVRRRAPGTRGEIVPFADRSRGDDAG